MTPHMPSSDPAVAAPKRTPESLVSPSRKGAVSSAPPAAAPPINVHPCFAVRSKRRAKNQSPATIPATRPAVVRPAVTDALDDVLGRAIASPASIPVSAGAAIAVMSPTVRVYAARRE